MLTIKTPVEYINQPDIIGDSGKFITKYGNKALIIGSKTPLKVVGEAFYKSLKEYEIEYVIEEFSGFPTYEIIERYTQKAKEVGVNLIIGIGGGKVNDIAKVVGTMTKLPVIAVPTIAATCATWAACSIIYKEDGDYDDVYWNEYTPRLILADTRIIATAPARYMNAGIVDTLAKWIETVPLLNKASDKITLNLSVSGAKLAYDILLEHGQKAVEDGQRNIITKSTMDTIDAIIYLAGFVGSFTEDRLYGGFAHPFYYATTRLPHTRHRLHGDKVALGLLVQLVLEKKPEELLIETIKVFNQFKLALTLEDIGVAENKEEDIHTITINILKDFPWVADLDYVNSAEEIEDAIRRTDALIKRVLDQTYNTVPRKALEQINNYVAAKTIESVKREMGIDKVIKLAGNENTHGYSPHVKKVLANSLEDLSYYPDMNCTKLREKLSKLHQVDCEELIFGNGSFELISMIALTFLEENDESILFEPSFGWYKNVTWQMGAKVVSLPLKDFSIDLDAAIKSVTNKTKIVWLCNPNNPTGTIITEQTLREFLSQLRSDILLVLDEAYIDFVTEKGYPESLGILRDYNNVILLRTFSKAYGLASLRIGYGIASKQVISSLNKVRLPINTNALAQIAAGASLEDQVFKQYVLDNNKSGLDMYYKVLTELGLQYIKSNCNFILFDTGLDSEWVAYEYLKKGIIIRAGKEFGLPTWVRITIGTLEENLLVIDELRLILNQSASSE